MHVHSEHALRLQNARDSLNPERSALSCHEIVAADPHTWRIVSYVKSKCDSGFVCTEFRRTAPVGGGVVTARFGPKARSPGEACSQLYFSRAAIKTVMLVSKRGRARTCPLSGRYQLQPTASFGGLDAAAAGVTPLSSVCASPTSVYVSAGCGSSALTIEAECGPGNLTKTSYSCHSAWLEQPHGGGGGGTVSPAAAGKNYLIIREEGAVGTFAASTLCLSYADKLMRVSSTDCGPNSGSLYTMSETAPCLQALSSQPTSSAASFLRSPTGEQVSLSVLAVLAVAGASLAAR